MGGVWTVHKKGNEQCLPYKTVFYKPDIEIPGGIGGKTGQT